MQVSRRSGFALPELVIAMLILGAALVPMAGVFTSSKTCVTMSRLQYTALVAARAELEELRQIDWDALEPRVHSWRPLTGHALLATVDAGGASRTVAQDPALKLPAEYARIETQLALGEVVQLGHSVMRRATLSVRWQENGAGHTRAPEALSALSTILASHKLVRGVR